MNAVESRSAVPPYFSICVPQYNRTAYLMAALDVLKEQRFRDFEVCVSDDCSTDGKGEELVAALRRSGYPFAFRRRERNGRYDANLRDSIDMARGRYCLLMGNDDCFKDPGDLGALNATIAGHAEPEVVITNFENYHDGTPYRRMTSTGIAGSGPSAALAHFRDFSFVGGVLLLRDAALRHRTERWDGSEMYQMYLGCRILAEGGRLLGVDRPVVRQSIRIKGQESDSYRGRPKENFSLRERPMPLHQITRLVADAVGPYQSDAERRGSSGRIYGQLLCYTYPFWLVEYRRVQSWAYAFGVWMAMRPAKALAGLSVGALRRLGLTLLYLASGAVSMLCPIFVFDAGRPYFHRLAKHSKRPRHA